MALEEKIHFSTFRFTFAFILFNVNLFQSFVFFCLSYHQLLFINIIITFKNDFLLTYFSFDSFVIFIITRNLIYFLIMYIPLTLFWHRLVINFLIYLYIYYFIKSSKNSFFYILFLQGVEVIFHSSQNIIYQLLCLKYSMQQFNKSQKTTCIKKIHFHFSLHQIFKQNYVHHYLKFEMNLYFKNFETQS